MGDVAAPVPRSSGRPAAWDSPVKNQRDQLREARQLGIEVRPVRRTGEVRLLVVGEPSVTINARRKGGTHAVESMLTRARPVETKEAPQVNTRPSQPPATSPIDAARAFIRGRMSEDVLRVMASEAKADLRIVALVERFDRRDARRAAKETTAD